MTLFAGPDVDIAQLATQTLVWTPPPTPDLVWAGDPDEEPPPAQPMRPPQERLVRVLTAAVLLVMAITAASYEIGVRTGMLTLDLPAIAAVTQTDEGAQNDQIDPPILLVAGTTSQG